MIPPPNPGEAPWQRELAEGLRTPRQLLEAGLIAAEALPTYEVISKKFKVFIPRAYAQLIDLQDPRCPIRLQALPHPRELEAEPAPFEKDPLGDLRHQPAPRVTHRYPNRALLHLTPNCGLYCRYCFRKHLLNELSPELFSGGIDGALAYFREHREIEEVILSGGDPLLLGDEALGQVLGQLRSIPHLRRLRIHSRVPATLPSRFTPSLLTRLADCGLPVVLVAHFNHPREVSPGAQAALQASGRAGIRLFNQSVLLRGVNDRVETLKVLSIALFEAGVQPYYLHHPDRAQGTQYFDLPREEGRRLYHELRSQLPGYLVPRYVVDEVGHPYKKDV